MSTDQQHTEEALPPVELEILDPASESTRAIFLPSGADRILADIAEQVKGLTFDMTVASDRKKCASVAAKIARTKTNLDAIGKSYVEDWKRLAKEVDTERKRLRDGLDALKEQVRAPLTEWEEAKAKREEEIELRIQGFAHAVGMVKATRHLTADRIQRELEDTRSIEITPELFGSRCEEGEKQKSLAIAELEAHLAAVMEAEAQAAELARLRKEAAERERKEREERIAREAAEKARLDFQRQHAEEVAAVEQARLAAEAEVRAARERAEALERERQQQEEEAAVERQKRRDEADRATSLKRDEAVACLMFQPTLHLDFQQACDIFDAILRGEISHVAVL